MSRTRKLSKRRAAWCKAYEAATTFEPLMDDFLAGNETFVEAALHSVRWFEDYSTECLHAIPDLPT